MGSSSDDLDAGLPARGPGTIAYYVTQSLVNAFKSFSGQPGMGDADADPRGFAVKQLSDWEPLKGYAANRARLVAVYDYYRDTYVKGRAKFSTYDRLLWAGLGRMAGSAVVGGLDMMISFPSSLKTGGDLPPMTLAQIDAMSPSDMTRRGGTTIAGMLVAGKQIFLDLAWQHEAYLDEPLIALRLAKEFDAKPDITLHAEHIVFRPYEDRMRSGTRQNSYVDAWTKINSNDPQTIAQGNQLLLQNEQYDLVQPVYDNLPRLDPNFNDPSPFTGQLHPYHRDFLVSGGKNILDKDQRWKWISEPGGMFDKWGVPNIGLTMKIPTREELVKLDFGQSIRHNWPVSQPDLIVGTSY
jgi:hypothetical protein